MVICLEVGDSVRTNFRYHSIIRSKIDTLFAEAKANNIQLLILVCPDKYDLYQDHIINNPYPIKTINEDFRRIVGDRADVIIGKELLYPHIHSVEKDMYYLDGTHWSYKSAKIIADSISRVYNLTRVPPSRYYLNVHSCATK